MRNAVEYTLELAEEIDPSHLLLCCLKAMKPDEVERMLKINELTPRFLKPSEKKDRRGPPSRECECGETIHLLRKQCPHCGLANPRYLETYGK